MSETLYLSLDAKTIAEIISKAKESICYAAPGIFSEIADALAEVSQRIGTESITVCLDLNEEVYRLGYGDIEALTTLRKSHIKLNSSLGLRVGIIIVDDIGYMFTPTALRLEAGQQSGAKNAVRLLESQITEVRIRISEKERKRVAQKVETERDCERIRRPDAEIESIEVQDSEIRDIYEKLEKSSHKM